MPDEVFVLFILSIVSVTGLGFGLMRTINRHLERKWGGHGLDEGRVLPEMEELRGRMDGVEDLQGRVLELEERVDFAERLLAEEKAPNTLGVGRGPAGG